MTRGLAALLGAMLVATPLRAQQPDAARVRAISDSVAAAALATGRAAGMAIAVVRGNDTLVLKGYGYADLEFDVPMPADAIFEIGSVTKQFTATAILQLADSGKLSLDDDLSKYFPAFPLGGRRIPLRRLMDHTSGIPSYTSLPEFDLLSLRALPRDSLVALVAGKPFDFEPGAEMRYNNTAYFLLGLIIEQVSGLSYADYVVQRLLGPAGMRDSRYCSEKAIVKRRAHGYDPGPTGLERAHYLDHTWPYAAGSLCSTVGDLVAWNRALHGGRLLSPARYRELLTAGTLADGTRLRYARGIAVDSLLGRRALHHGGDINGFASELAWFPDAQLTIAVLVNSEGPVRPQAIARRLAEAVLGPDRTRAATLRGKPSDYAGRYSVAADSTSLGFAFRADSAGTALVLDGGPRLPRTRLRAVGPDVFDAPDTRIGNVRFTFLREGGRVTAVRFDPVFRNQLLARRDSLR